MKRIISLVCSAAMLLSFAACGASGSTPDASASLSAYKDTTITGQVSAISGTSVTLQLGTIEEPEFPGEMPPPEKPDGEPGSAPDGTGSDDRTPPEKPDGELGSAPDGTDSDDRTPPEKPDGEPGSAPDGADSDDRTPPEKPDGKPGSAPPDGKGGGRPRGGTFTAGDETASIDLADVEITSGRDTVTVSDLAEDDILTITFDENGAITGAELVRLDGFGGPPANMGGGGFGGSGEVTQGSSANTISEDGSYSGDTYTSTGDDENALRVDGATVTLSGITVDKSSGSSSNTEDGDFYGMNAALLATNGATVTIENAAVTSGAQNGNGVFSYGEGTTVNISNTTITTTADNSGGIQTTGGATTNAANLTINTSGNSAAAIRSDRGGGTVNVDGGTYTSNGYNSPAVYSTAAITVKNAALTANNSEALVIEGKNSITLENCDVTGNMSDTQGASSDENVHNVMIYQSMSGDAEVGTSSFSMAGGTLTAKNGDMFYVTNTHCVMTLSGVTIVNEDAEANLFTVTGNSASRGWGAAGSNGAQLELTADAQALSGNIVVDSISTLDLVLTNGSSLTGTINIADNAEGGAAVENNAVVTIEQGCTWTLTGDCTVTSITNNGTISYNGYTITLADGTVLGG